MDTHLELVVIPVSDVDRAKAFYSMPTRSSRPSVFTPSRRCRQGSMTWPSKTRRRTGRGSSRLFRFLDGNLTAAALHGTPGSCSQPERNLTVLPLHGLMPL